MEKAGGIGHRVEMGGVKGNWINEGWLLEEFNIPSEPP